MTARHHILPAHGALLVSTDLHGNHEDLDRLVAVFTALGPDAHWVILGDLVHGPDDRARREEPTLYDWPDASARVVETVAALCELHPARVHLVLGNHDHGHVGGPHTAKFYRDEVAQLEGTLDESSVRRLRALFSDALLAVAAPCGVLLTHGSPDDRLERLDDLDRIALHAAQNGPYEQHVLASVLRSYGQPRERTERLLEKLRATSGLDLRVVIHGHDRDEEGIFREGGNQVCPVLFGALREHKRYVVLDLAAHYTCADDLREGIEVRRLYAAP